MTSPTAGFTSGAGVATVAYTMPKQTTSNAFANLSERLVLEDIRNAGGYFTAAKQMANFPENMGLETSVSLMIVMDMENPLFLLKVMHEEFRVTWTDEEGSGLAFDRIPMDISEIYPLTSLVVDKLERSKHFENHFVPLNSIIQVVIIPENPSKNLLRDIGFLILGLIALAFGSNFLVSGAVDLARIWGLSEALIGLTIVSIGTGTPELATALMAAYRKTADIAIGNAVGSNLFNIMFVVGLAGLVAPMDATGINSSDLYVMFGLTILLLPTVWTGMVLDRKEGFLFMAIYVAYLYYLLPVK